jgi:ABC-type multidrug transport system fused ATPase/permease subunit
MSDGKRPSGKRVGRCVRHLSCVTMCGPIAGEAEEFRRCGAEILWHVLGHSSERGFLCFNGEMQESHPCLLHPLFFNYLSVLRIGRKTAYCSTVSKIIELSDVRAGYRRDAPVLDGISVAVKERELVAILGSSGVGKSTLLRVVAGLLAPQEGSVVIFGRNVADIQPRDRSIGFVFQQLALFPHLSVQDNANFGIRYSNAGKAEAEQQVQRLLGSLSLSLESMFQTLPLGSSRIWI